LQAFVKLLKIKKYKECVYFKSINNRYVYNGFTVDITKHDFLGTWLEIEKITNKKIT
jgi:adenylate cyclase class IV